MPRPTPFSTAIGSLLLAGLAWSLCAHGGSAASPAPAQSASQSHPPSDAEIQARAQKLIENQHRDDEAIEQYERIEHQVDRSGGTSPRVLEEKTYRIVPTGTGTLKLLLKEGNTPVDPAAYREQLQAWKDVLEIMLKPEDSRAKTAYAKWQKKKTDRAEIVDATRTAFLVKWVGQETVNGRPCDILELNPNPAYHPRTMFQDGMTHITAKIWVDLEANQLSRAEAHVMRDVSFGGGILGKLYRGGVFFFEQTEVAPGIWLPARYQYDFTARKFLFTFEQHQYIEVSQYRRDGPPRQVLALVQSELASGKVMGADP